MATATSRARRMASTASLEVGKDTLAGATPPGGRQDEAEHLSATASEIMVRVPAANTAGTTMILPKLASIDRHLGLGHLARTALLVVNALADGSIVKALIYRHLVQETLAITQVFEFRRVIKFGHESRPGL